MNERRRARLPGQEKMLSAVIEHHDLPRTLQRKPLGVLMIVTSVVGWYASFALVVDKLTLLADPQAALGCDFSPFVSCGDVLGQWQAELFGFPNPIIGIAAYMVPLIIGIALLARVEFPRWFWNGLNIGVLLGAALITWLFTQSVFVISVLCPWCIVVWAMQIPLFVTITLHNAAHGRFGTVGETRVARAITGAPWTVVVLWYAVIAVSILAEFFDYWAGLI